MALALTPSGNQGIGTWPRRRARMSPSRLALSQGTRTVSYPELADRTSRLATGLLELGVRPGGRVAYLGQNDIGTFEALFAAGQIGAVFAPLNTRLTVPELGYMLRDSGAEVLLVGHGVDAVVPGLRQDVAGCTTILEVDELERLVAGCDPLAREAEVTLDDPALMLYTSGTTGKPKAAVLTHGNLTWNTINQLAHVDIAGTDRAMCISPLFHAVGLGQVTLPTLFKGGSVEVLPRFDAAAVLQLIEEHGVTSFSGVPIMLQLMSEHPAWESADLSSLRFVIYGGSSVPERVASAWLRRGVPILQGYGMTEASPGIYLAMEEGSVNHPVSVGVPHFFTDVAVLDDEGAVQEMPHDGSAHEVVVRGPHVFAGYWAQPEETAAAIADGRWFKTGDVLRTEPDHWAHVVDRVKDVIISGAENIYPAEVEEVALALDGIRAAALVARPDERWGEVGVLYVEAAAGVELDERVIRDHLATRLARYKLPQHIHVVTDLPRSATGKILRVGLRQQARLDATPPDRQELR